MPKAWRRTASAFGGAPSIPTPPSVPRIITAIFQPLSGNIRVTFDQDVTYDGTTVPAMFQTEGGEAAGWTQVSTSILDALAGCGTIFAAGQTFSWAASDTGLTPIPDPSQTGTVG